MHKLNRLAALGFGLLMSLQVLPGHAQDAYPNKPVHVIVPFPAGGINDIVARLVADKLSSVLKTSFVIENRGGAGGTIGSAVAAKALPDGYTLLLGAASTIAVNPYLYPNPGYDPAKDLAPIGAIGSVPSVLLTAKGETFGHFQDVVKAAKAAPGKLTFGSAGAGASQHVQMELLKLRLGLDMLHVPYKGGAPAMNDLLGKQIDFMLEPLPTAMAQVEGKRVKALALSKAERVAALPDVPTFEEVGVPDFLVSTWFGLFAPANTPPAIMQRLESALASAMQDPQLLQTMASRGIEPLKMDGAGFANYVRQEQERWKGVITQANIRLN